MTADSRRSRGKVLIGVIVFIVVASAAGIGAWAHFSGKESTDDAQVDGHINAISARIGGIVTAVNVKENLHVNAGDVLVTIDTRDYQIALARAEAELADGQAALAAAKAGLPIVSVETGSRNAGTQAGLMRAQAGVESAQKDVEVARARLALAKSRAAEAQAAWERTQKDLDRWKRLITKDEISQQQFDAGVSAEATSRAAVESARAAIVEAETGVAAAESRIPQARGAVGQAEAEVQASNTGDREITAGRARVVSAEARIKQAEAAIDQAKLNMEYAVVKAPVSGMVSRKNVEVGQVIQAGQPLFAIVPLDDTWITANFKETQLENMKVGQSVTIAVDAYGGAKFSGRIESISAATGARFSLLPPENASGNYVKVVQRVPVRIILDRGADPQQILRPGMSVVATVDVQAASPNGKQ